jgi:hypothetical protein
MRTPPLRLSWPGGLPERIHINRIVAGDVQMGDYAMVIVPGAFLW